MAFEAWLCALAIGACGQVPETQQRMRVDAQELDMRAQVVAREMVMGMDHGARWLRSNPWAIGSIPTADAARYPAQTGARWTPPSSLRLAITTAAGEGRLWAWHQEESWLRAQGLANYRIHRNLVDTFGRSRERNFTFAVGISRNNRVEAQHRDAVWTLPDALAEPVPPEVVLIGGQVGGYDGCGTQPAAGSLPGSSTPAPRRHYDSWKVTTQCTYDPLITATGSHIPRYRKTLEVRGCNVTDVFLPTIGQLTSTAIFTDGRHATNPRPPAWAPQTNPSTYYTSDCAADPTNPEYTKAIVQEKGCDAAVPGDRPARRTAYFKYNTAGVPTGLSYDPPSGEFVPYGPSCYVAPPMGCYWILFQEPSNGVLKAILQYDPAMNPATNAGLLLGARSMTFAEANVHFPGGWLCKTDELGLTDGPSSGGSSSGSGEEDMGFDTDGDGIADSSSCAGSCRGDIDSAKTGQTTRGGLMGDTPGPGVGDKATPGDGIGEDEGED